MRVSLNTLTEHRRALVDQASRLFRRSGLDGVGVAEISRAAGLTHGAFYGHFPSKAGLAAEACATSLQSGAARWRDLVAQAQAAGADPLGALIDNYLSESHRDAPERGCILSSLGPEIGRAEPLLRAALDDGVTGLSAVLADTIAGLRPDLARDACDSAALAVLSALAGGLILARACRDPSRSRAALTAAAAMARAALPPG